MLRRLELEHGAAHEREGDGKPGDADVHTREPKTRRWPRFLGIAIVSCVLAVSLALLAESPYYSAPPWPSIHLPRSWHKPTHNLSFYVIGDWGRKGNRHQSRVAALMGELARAYHPSFVISVGDNFYSHGLNGPNDPLFAKSFSNVYTAKGLQVPFMAVLGNHDYGDFMDTLLRQFHLRSYAAHWQDTSTVAGKQLASRDPRWICRQGAWRRSFGKHLDVVFLDTNPLYHSQMWSSISGKFAFKNNALMLERLEGLLRSSSATFKLVVGHHPIRSFGERCEFRETAGDCAYMSVLDPLLKKYQVDAYFSGHDHNLQLIRAEKGSANDTSSLLYVVSGAGSNIKLGAQEKIPKRLKASGRVWMSESPGFVAASLTAGSLTLDFWDAPSKQKLYSVRKRATAKHARRWTRA